VFLGLGLVFFSRIPNTEAAFGISPPFLNATHLVKGSKYVQTIYLVQDQPEQDLTIKADLDIPERIRSWIALDKGFQFVIPKGTRQFPLQVTVQVPRDTELGSYHGTLTFTTVPGQAGQVTIALGAQVAINLTVGEGIYEKFSVALIRFMDIEEGWNPRVYVKFNNEGNIPEAFTGATYELLDQFGGTRLAYIQKSKGFPETPPFTVSDYIVEFPIDFHLGIGQYWASVNFYQRETLVASQKTVFNVLKRGSISSPTARFLSFLKENPGYSAGIGAVIAGGAVFAVIKRKRKRRLG
jgi:hypothetical protein